MNSINFTKMHGAGNDFMVINGIASGFVPTRKQLILWSNRHFGVGFDQLLLVEKSVTKGVDFKYRIFNSDGNEVSQCGNGARCLAKFIKDNGLINKNKIIVETISGIISLEIMVDDKVKVDMGAPEFSPEKIPLLKPTLQDKYTLKIAGNDYEFMSVAIGNPHAVFIVGDVDDFPVASIGKAVESHQLFPERVNAGFMQIIDADNIKLRVYERGVGETLACGSGACAAVANGIRAGLLTKRVKVMAPGGELLVEWPKDDEHIFLIGPAVSVYSGTIAI